MRSYRDDRRRIRSHAAGAKLSQDPLLQIIFGERFLGAHTARRFGKGRLRNRINGPARGPMPTSESRIGLRVNLRILRTVSPMTVLNVLARVK